MLISMRNMLSTAVVLTALVWNTSSFAEDSFGGAIRRSLRTDDIICMPLLKHIQYARNGSDNIFTAANSEEWECETMTNNGRGIGKLLKFENLSNIPEHIMEQFDSGRTILTIPGATVVGNNLRVPPANGLRDVTIRKMNHRGSGGRKLLQSGDKTVLVVRVKTNGALTSEPTSNAPRLGDSVFGTLGDPVNLRSQYEACSYGTITFSPTTSLSVSMPAPGVYEIEVTVADTSHSTVVNAVMSALPSSLEYDHILTCLPPGTDGSWIAYAYINSALSVYNDEWCTYVSGQLHELGHNLGLGHAGEGSSEYGDQSGMMGYSYSSSDSPVMCFNAAKSWQLGWFDTKALVVYPLDTSIWTGKLVGMSDYTEAGATDSVLIKLETQTPTDYYINFNRKSGINSGTREGGNQVLITSQGGNGQSYSPSSLLSKLSQGGSYTIDNFGGSGNSVTITVDLIDLTAFPPCATLTIDSGTSQPTASPSPSSTPSQQPSTLPSSTPTQFVCTTDEECRRGLVLACATPDWCDAGTCVLRVDCDCNGICDGHLGEDELTCPSDCVPALSEFQTTQAAGITFAGNMFDVQTNKDIEIISFKLKVSSGSMARVYTKHGSYIGYENDASSWTLIQDTSVASTSVNGLRELPRLTHPVFIRANQTQAFYVTMTDGSVHYTRGTIVGNLFATDGTLSFYEGLGRSYPFGSIYSPRVWNGNITYVVVPEALPQPFPSATPSGVPSSEPSLSPSQGPYVSPSDEPSTSPSDTPSLTPSQLTPVPSVLLSDEPSTSPSDAPSTVPSEVKPVPSDSPSVEPSLLHSLEPSMFPSDEPSTIHSPSDEPSLPPSQTTAEPSAPSSDEPSFTSSAPTDSLEPTANPSSNPTLSAEPSVHPTSVSTVSFKPSTLPSGGPTLSAEPSGTPSSDPTGSVEPTGTPSSDPTLSAKPSFIPSSAPTVSFEPSVHPTSAPTVSSEPSASPSDGPSSSSRPSLVPSDKPSELPSLKPTAKSAWATITWDDFEQGFGSFAEVPGSKDTAWVSYANNRNQQQYLPRNSSALRIRDDSGDLSSVFQYKDHDVSSFSVLKVSFWYYPRSMEGAEDFFLEFSSDSGASWTIVRQWVHGVDFQNDIVYFDSVEFGSPAVVLNSHARLRYRCDASGNGDYVYIDDVLFQGKA